MNVNLCPICFSKNIETIQSIPSDDGLRVVEPTSCNDCGSGWNNILHLKHQIVVSKGEKAE